jgi:hypothetical protein
MGNVLPPNRSKTAGHCRELINEKSQKKVDQPAAADKNSVD